MLLTTVTMAMNERPLENFPPGTPVVTATGRGIVLASDDDQHRVLVRWLEKPKDEWVDVENLRRASATAD